MVGAVNGEGAFNLLQIIALWPAEDKLDARRFDGNDAFAVGERERFRIATAEASKFFDRLQSFGTGGQPLGGERG